MSLSKHVDPDHLIKSVHEHRVKKLTARGNENVHSGGVYASRYENQDVPKYRLPSQGISAQSALQLVRDELTLDGNPALNFASFVHTWMPNEATQLVSENVSKNLIDGDEYPATTAIHTRCISMLAHLWKVPKHCTAIGTATTGSSEAIMLGGLALKKRWQAKRAAEGKDASKPNIIMGANAQVALEKFARYFDVEARMVNVDESTNYCMDPKRAIEKCDENTIGVFVILGSTYTGHYEPVLEMSNLLDDLQAKKGLDIPIHVDGASGGYFAPFAHPDLKWSFDVPRVHSINTSGHKFGLTYVGVGWVVWKDQKLLPKELVFELHYLGSVEYSFSLNFSRPAAPILAQYWSMIHLGFEGYRRIALSDLQNARLLSRALEKSGYYKVISSIHHKRGATRTLVESVKDLALDDHDPVHFEEGLPVVAFMFSDKIRKEHPVVSKNQKWIQTLLRARGFIVPNYELPPNVSDQEVLRVVVRESMAEDLVDRLVADIIEVTEQLIKMDHAGDTQSILDIASGRTDSSKSVEHQHRQHGHEGSKPKTYAKPC